ncbi:MAG TPA: hypothetical protein VLM75_11015 [Spirochaetota bacterium]|nr:hypothetical protein [Spirochaetota bacterium]
MKRFILVFAASVFLCTAGGFPGHSYHGIRDCACAKQSLKKGLKPGDVIPALDPWYGYQCAWATSTLAATGKPPARPKPPADAENDEDDFPARRAYMEWSCMYAAGRLTDGSPETCWAEGAKGDGTGEIVIARVDTKTPLEIWTGLGKSEKLYRENGRPRKANVYVLQAVDCAVGQYSEIFTDVTVLARHTIELKDINGYQPLLLPAHKPLKTKPSPSCLDQHTTFVAIEILSVYPGSKYRDTCISEIRAK